MATKLILRQLPTSTPATTGASEVKGTPLTNLEVDQNFINLQSAVDGGTSTSPTISGGSINSTPIGATTASTGAFTTLSASGAVTLSGGTANSVPYLNGSKVLTTGSTLVFDGTNLGIGTSVTGAAKVVIHGASAAPGVFDALMLRNSLDGGAALIFDNSVSGPLASIEAQVTSTGAGTDDGILVFSTAAGGVNAEHMYLNSSGNLGLGVTPSAWSASAKAIQFGNYAGIYQNASGLAEFSFNSYQNTSNIETYRVSANPAAKYQIGAGTHKWSTAPSGTAGNPITFTQAMTLDASGNLGLGVTPSAWNIGVKALQVGTGSMWASAENTYFGSNYYYAASNRLYSSNGYALEYLLNANDGSYRWYNAPSGTAGNPISFTQAMTLDASGSLNIANLTASKTVFTDASKNLTTTGTVAVLQGGTGVTTSTGTGSVVLSNSPTLITPALGTPASGVATNLTGLPLTTGVTGQLGVGNGGTGVTTSTGTGSVVLSNSPTLVTPALGTPASGVATNLTGLPLTTGVTGQLGALNGGTGLLGIAAVSIPVANVLNTYTTVSPLGGQSIRVNAGGTAWEAYTPSTGSGSVSSVSVTSGNGFAGTVLTSTSTPAITLSTTITGVLKGNGTAISAATAGTDYIAPGSATTYTATQNFAASGITLKGSGTGFTTFASANASVTNYTLTFPAATGTVLTTAAAITADQGGTGQQTYAVGDILYASAATTLSKLADVATGSSLISGGVGVAPSWGKIGLATHVSGQLGVGNGGTGAATAQLAINALAGAVTSAQYLRGNGTNVVMSAIQAADVPTLNQNTTGSAGSLSATLVATSGGTGQSTYAVGDLLYASTTSALSKLADVATGNSLISGGVGAAPSWGKIGLTTHVSGTLPVANGGTGGANATDARTNLGATTVGSSLFTLTNPSAITFPQFNANNTVSTLDAGTFRTAIGATTVGSNLFTLTNPSAITFPRFNANNTVSTLDAATFRTAIGAGTSSTTGTVTSVAALTIGATGTDITSTVATGTTTPVITLNIPTASATNRGALSAADWTTFNNKTSNTGTVTSVSVTSGNGFAGSVTTSTTTPAITLSTTITGVIKGNGTAIIAATAGTDYVSPTGTETLSNKTLSGVILNSGYSEQVFDITGTVPAISPTNGSIQTWILTGNSVPTLGTWGAGQSITLMIDDGTASTINWTNISPVWKTNGGTAPTLQTTGFTAIVLWKVGTTIYGARVGDA